MPKFIVEVIGKDDDFAKKMAQKLSEKTGLDVRPFEKLDAEALAKEDLRTMLQISAALAGDPVAVSENVKKVDLMRQREERDES